MPSSTFNLEFADHNSVRRYPLAITADAVALAGGFELPNTVLVGMDLPVHASLAVDPSRFFLRSLGWFGDGLSLTLGYDDPATGETDVAAASIPADGHQPHQAYALTGVGDFADTRGVVAVGELGGLSRQPVGRFAFSLEQARLDPDVVRPSLRGVSAVRVRTGDGVTQRLTGDIELVAGGNVTLSVSLSPVDQHPVIQVSAISGEGLSQDCECDPAGDRDPIYTINGVPPTPAGDFTLVGNQCSELQPATAGLQLVDTCAKPCCGCEELEAITRRLENLDLAIPTLQNFIQRLDAQVTQMNAAVLGSRLGDASCT